MHGASDAGPEWKGSDSSMKLLNRVTEVPSRTAHILYTLAKYGLAQFVTYLPFYSRIFARLRKGKKVRELLALSLGEKLRHVAVELGPTFIKFGQLLSSRKDLIPEDILKELEKLQDNVPPFPVEEAKRIVEESLGKPVDRLFDEFTDEPEAAASLAQVHRAVLSNGKKVAVKIKRPGIETQIDIDLLIMQRLAKFVDRNTHFLRPLSAVEMVEEFSLQIRRELSFRNEFLNIQKFRKAAEDDESIIIPRPYEKYTTDDVLVLAFVEGENINKVIESDDPRYNKKQIVKNATDFLVTHMLFDGLLHADPHPGNLIVPVDGRVCLIDFGMVYNFQPVELEQLNYLMLGLGRLDSKLVARSILKLGRTTREIDETELQQALYDLMESYLDRPLEYIEVSRAFIELLRLVINFGIRLPSRLVYVAKVLSTLESIAQDLDSSFNIVEYLRSISTQIWAGQFASGRFRNKLTVSALDWGDALLHLPNTADAVKRFFEEREVKVRMPDVVSMQETVDKVGFRMVFGLVLAAILVSSSLVVLAGVGPTMGDMPIFGFIGFAVGTAMGVLFLFSAMIKMIRWRKRK